MSLCLYGSCHNLGSSLYQGYCTKEHYERRHLFTILETHPNISTLREARLHLLKSFTSSSHCASNGTFEASNMKKSFTSSSHCEVCKGFLRESDAYPKASVQSISQTAHNPDSKP